MALNFDLFNDLELEFSRSNFQEWDGRLTLNKRDVS